MVLFLLIGFGTKSYGQAAGDYVFTQATDTLWATVGNWSISDGAGGYTGVASVTPTATTNVWIPAGKRLVTVGANVSVTTAIVAGSANATLSAASATLVVGMAVKGTGIAPGTYVAAINGTAITLSAAATSTNSAISLAYYPACKNLTVNGYFLTSAQFVVYGDITVNIGGSLKQTSDLYCANINNFGTFYSSTNYRSSKSLYVGFSGAVPGTGDYNIVNDGTFGDSQAVMPAGTGSGIFVLYSNQANSLTIKPSPNSTNNYKFNISAILPHANIKTAANTQLNIKENMSLLRHNGIGLSIQNNDTCPGTTRTCTIDPGVTVYVGYNFHANRNVTTNDQGNFIYNVYGTLDLGTFATSANNTTATAANTSDFGLCMSTVAGNAGTLTFNLGDGTQANAGTLILGSNVKIVKQRTQTVAVNFKNFSTVKVKGNLGWMMNYQLLNNNVPAPYLMPSKFYNLAIDSAKYVMPVKPIVRGTYTAPTGRAIVSNWAAPTNATKLSTSLYFGTTATNAPQGSIVYTGSAFYYVPVVRATTSYTSGNQTITLSGDTTLNYIQAGDTITGGSGIAARVTSLTGSSLLMTAAASPSSAQNNVTISFIGMQGAVAPTGTVSPVFDGTQALIYLGTSDFATPVMAPNAVNTPGSSTVLVYSNQHNQVVISNATAGDIATIYSVSGMKVASTKLTSENTTVNITSGIYLVKVNNSVSKVVVR